MSCFTRLPLNRFVFQGRILRPLEFFAQFSAKTGRSTSKNPSTISQSLFCIYSRLPLSHTSRRFIQTLTNVTSTVTPFPESIEIAIQNLVGSDTHESHAQSLSSELSKSLSRKDVINMLIGSHEFLPLFTDSQNHRPSTCILDLLLSHNRISTAALFIVALLNIHSKEQGHMLLLDSCGHLLVKGQSDYVFQILKFWSEYFIQSNLHRSESLIPDASSLAKDLISLAGSIGKPLLAASLCLRLDEVGLLDQDTLQQTVSLLMISHPTQNQFNIKTISELHKQLKNTQVELTTEQKGQLLQMASNFSYDKFPSMLNDTFNLVQHIPGGDVPVSSLFKMIKSNLRYNNTSRAAVIAREISQRQLTIDQYDLEIMGLMIRNFSKTRKYLDIAHHLVSIIPEEYYIVEGLTEILLSYCARTKNQELAVTVYSQLEAPIPRSVLTALLHLHISFGDSGGAEKILLEIARRNDALRPVEFSMIVQAALQQNLEKAANLARKNAPQVAKLAYGSIINKAIEENNMDIADEFIDLAYENLGENDRVFDSISTLIIKRILKQENSQEARLQWIQWKSASHKTSKIRLPKRNIQIINLRAIADKAMSEGNSHVVNWVVQELRHLGMHMSDIRKELSKRSNLKTIESPQFLKPN